jgi:ABC-type branched-subunit amino acid transport system permease subunit
VEVFIRTTLLGLVTGSIYAMSATGLVLTYKTSGILNLGYGALAMFTTIIHWQFIGWGMPIWLSAIVVVLVIAPLIGVFLDTQIFRRIEDQPRVIAVMATVGLIVLLQGVVFNVWGTTAKEIPSLFPQRPIKIPGGGSIGLDAILVLLVAAASAGLLAAMLRFTRLGVAFRAVVDSRPVAGLMAINTSFVSATAWALGTAFAALSGILLAPRLLLLDPAIFPPFIISFVLGAAMVGYLRSLPLAFAGGLLIGLIQGYVVQYSNLSGLAGNLSVAAPFVLMTVLVLAAPSSIRRAGMGTSFMVRTRELAGQASARVRGSVAAVLFVVLALAPIFVSSISWRLSITSGMARAIIFLSIVILTGYSGQISLGHTAFMGLAAFTAAHLAGAAGLPIWLAFALGVLAAVPAGALIGIAAVRLHGIFLALMTLALAFLAQQIFFQDPIISGAEGILPLARPAGFEGNNAFYYLVLLFLLGSIALAANLRSGRTGRVLAAMRDSETATRSIGINVVKYKVIIFSLSAAMASLGGLLIDMQKQQVTGRIEFIPFFSLVYVTLAVVGGVFHIGGAIAVGMFYGLFQEIFKSHPFILDLQFILFGLGATTALAQNPEGMFGEMRRGGHALLRLFARGRATPREPLPVAGGQE